MIQDFNEFKKRGISYSGDTVKIFDIDDTLLISKAKVEVTDTETGDMFELTPEEYNTYVKKCTHEVDYNQFCSLEIMKAGKLIDKYFNILMKEYNKGTAIGFITARNDRELIYNWIREAAGIRIDMDLIYAVNDLVHGFSGSIAQKKKQAFKEFIDKGFIDFEFFDDDKENIKLIKQVVKEYPNLKIKVVHAKK